MATYQTEQKKELISFLSKNSQRSFTIEEICKGMLEDNDCLSPPGKSTLYRLIPKLLAENTIKQFSDSRGKRAAYQIVGGTECRRHIHLKCTICGKIFHMSEEATSALCKCVSGSDAFRISTEETILYGICKDCV